MARGTTLGILINMLRIEARMDPNPALSKNLLPLMTQSLQMTQERVYDDFDWPHLKVTRDVIASAGERYYNLPSDMNLERIITVDYRWGNRWLPLDRGIDLDNYNSQDSDNNSVRADPAMRWDVIDTGAGVQIEIWPLPATNGGAIRFKGLRKLSALIATGDRADLDDQVIVLYAAAEMLATTKDAAAQIKLQKAKKRLDRLQGRMVKTRTKSFSLGGAPNSGQDDGHHRGTPLVAYVRAP